MNYTVHQVKTVLPTIIDKLVGFNNERLTDEEIDLIKFAFESNVLFDGTSQQFTFLFSSLPTVDEMPPLEGLTEEERKEIESRIEEQKTNRSNVVKTILIMALKEHLAKELKMRFGV